MTKSDLENEIMDEARFAYMKARESRGWAMEARRNKDTRHAIHAGKALVWREMGHRLADIFGMRHVLENEGVAQYIAQVQERQERSEERKEVSGA